MDYIIFAIFDIIKKNLYTINISMILMNYKNIYFLILDNIYKGQT